MHVSDIRVSIILDTTTARVLATLLQYVGGAPNKQEPRGRMSELGMQLEEASISDYPTGEIGSVYFGRWTDFLADALKPKSAPPGKRSKKARSLTKGRSPSKGVK